MAVFDFSKGKRHDYVLPVDEQPDAMDTAIAPAALQGKRLLKLPVCDILPNPNQPRKTFDETGIEELAQSIKQVGLIQPVVVRQTGAGYVLVAGERRLRACKLLGMLECSCIVEDGMVEQEGAMVALIENLQRENLHYLEEAACYAQLISAYGLTQEELAIRLGKSQSAIANKLRLLRLTPTIKEAMTAARMTERHARALLRLKDEATQLSVIDKVRAKGLSVKETERMVEKTLNRQYDEKRDGAAPRPRILRYLRDYRMFVNTVTSATKQLEEAGMTVEIEQTDTTDGIDLFIRVRR
ncbi:MAG: ParB/RepB/Spo0J family partition protein [Clostridiales bacterium]|jgi:ParB family chromosome partitioning protein|nr:ParB/RepB/Spo0J family partition protein [Clostridiales bacterium]